MKLFVIVLLAGVAYAGRLENTYLPPGSAKTAGGNGQFLGAPFNGGQVSSIPRQSGHFSGSGSIGFNVPSTAYGVPISANSRIPSQHSINSSPVYRPGQFSSIPRQSGSGSIGFNAPSTAYGSPISNNNHIPSQHSLTPSPAYGPANFRSNNPEARANTLKADNNNDGSGNYRFDYETENRISQSEEGQLKHVTDGEATVVHGSYSYTGDDGKEYTVNYIADENGFQPSGEHISHAISATASDAAKSASSEVQPGYNYNSQQKYATQGGYNGYSTQQQNHQSGLSGHQAEVNTHPSVFNGNTQQAGFSGQQPGFSNAYSQKAYNQIPVNNGGYRY